MNEEDQLRRAEQFFEQFLAPTPGVPAESQMILGLKALLGIGTKYPPVSGYDLPSMSSNGLRPCYDTAAGSFKDPR